MWSQAAGQARTYKMQNPILSMCSLCVGEELLCVTDESRKAERSELW